MLLDVHKKTKTFVLNVVIKFKYESDKSAQNNKPFDFLLTSVVLYGQNVFLEIVSKSVSKDMIIANCVLALFALPKKIIPTKRGGFPLNI